MDRPQHLECDTPDCVHFLKADKAYYGKDAPILSDRGYDALYGELARWEKKTGVIPSGSPTQRVSGEGAISWQDFKELNSKTRMETEGLAEQTLETMVDRGWVKDFGDLYEPEGEFEAILAGNGQ